MKVLIDPYGEVKNQDKLVVGKFKGLFNYTDLQILGLQNIHIFNTQPFIFKSRKPHSDMLSMMGSSDCP